MGMTIAQMRANAAAPSLPERSYELCLAQDLVSEVQALEQERSDLLVALGRDEDGETAKRPKRNADPRDARVTEIDQRLDELLEQMREHTGTLVLRGKTGGDWRRWVDEHPPRQAEHTEGQPPGVNLLDLDVAGGFCNAHDLLDSLGAYAATWNGEPVTSEDWDFITTNAGAGDLKELCRLVVGMHERAGVRPPKASSTPSSTTPRRQRS